MSMHYTQKSEKKYYQKIRVSSTVSKVKGSQEPVVRKELQNPLTSGLISHPYSILPTLDFSHIRLLTIVQVPRPFHDTHAFALAVLSS